MYNKHEIQWDQAASWSLWTPSPNTLSNTNSSVCIHIYKLPFTHFVILKKKNIYMHFQRCQTSLFNQLSTQHLVGIKSASFRRITSNQRWLNADPKMQTVRKIVQQSFRAKFDENEQKLNPKRNLSGVPLQNKYETKKIS